jgi:hypothetical protein
MITLPCVGLFSSKAPRDWAPPSLAVRQQPLIMMSMQNTTPPVRLHVGVITQAVFESYRTLYVIP